MSTQLSDRPLPTVPPRPAQPIALVGLIRANNHAVHAHTRALLSGNLDAYTAAGHRVAACRTALLSWTASPAGQAYVAAVENYTAAVHARNTAVALAHQARINAREVAAVRSAACPVCYTTHAGEC